MDAKLVWDTWRRILSDDQLVEQVLEKNLVNSIELPKLTVGEMAIVSDYASTKLATATNIAMYRQGLVRNALAALSLVPLTRHLLYLSGLDVETAAVGFCQATRYFDFGPNFWQSAGGFVTHLASLPEFAVDRKLDVLMLDAAMIALAQRLGKAAPKVWPEIAVGRALGISGAVTNDACFVANCAGTVATSNYDLTEWLENSDDFDTGAELERSKRYWLIYFNSRNAAPEYAELSERTARVFNFLSTPRTAAQLSDFWGGTPTDEIFLAIAPLVEMGLIVQTKESVSLGSKDSLWQEQAKDDTTVADLSPTPEELTA